MPQDKKARLTEEAVQLKKEFDSLTSYVYFNGCIKNIDDFKKLILLCQNNYVVINSETQAAFTLNSNMDWDLNTYIANFPEKVHKLEALERKLTDFIDRVKKRAPHILKTGNFSTFVSIIINSNALKQVISDARYIASNSNKKLIVESNVGANCAVDYSKMSDRLEEGYSGMFKVKNYKQN